MGQTANGGAMFPCVPQGVGRVERAGLDSIQTMAAKYIWWESPMAAMRHPTRVIAQVMNIGDLEDAQALLKLLGDLAFREALAEAEPGWFNARSWTYWHYKLGLTDPGGPVPPMPVRRLP